MHGKRESFVVEYLAIWETVSQKRQNGGSIIQWELELGIKNCKL
jgi:hypothetical protein